MSDTVSPESFPFRTIAATAFKLYPKPAVLGLALFIGQAFLYNGVRFNLRARLIDSLSHGGTCRTRPSRRNRLVGCRTVLSNRLRVLWLNLVQGLWFIPGLVVVLYAGLAVGLGQVDQTVDFTGAGAVFKGDGSAARTVLSVLAGSLITVAGLTFSVTVVVLQLASSQFSPRVLRTFFGDRLTQITVGSYVGIFVYSILVLRSVGSFSEGRGFVPRLSITVASALGIAAVVLLIVFIHHVSRMIQVSHITASIAMQTLERVDGLYPDAHGVPLEHEDSAKLLSAWRAEAPSSRVLGTRPGYVQRVGLDELVKAFTLRPGRLALLVRPGDFVSPETPLVEVWPAEAAEGLTGHIRAAAAIANERDIGQDVAFGLRQLADIALKAMSPGINDPTTAVTAISYIRGILVELARRSFPPTVRRFPESGGLEVIAERRSFADHLVYFLEIGRYASGDAHVVAAMLNALASVARVALESGARDRAHEAADVAATIAAQAEAEVKTERDRETVVRLLAEVRRAANG